MANIPDHRLPTSSWTVEKSNFLEKERLTKGNLWPSKEEIYENLGPPLAAIVLSQFSPIAKKMVGLPPFASDPTDSCLIPNETSGNEPGQHERYLQMIIRNGNIRAPMGRKSSFNEEEKNNVGGSKAIRGEITKAILMTRNEEKQKHYQEMDAALSKQKMYFNDLIKSIEEKHAYEMRKATEDAIKTVTESVTEEVENLVRLREDHLLRQFNFQLEWVKHDMQEGFSKILREHQARWGCLFNEAERASDNRLDQMKTVVTAESHKIATALIYEERKQCSDLIELLGKGYKGQLQDINRLIDSYKDSTIYQKKVSDETEKKLQSSIHLIQDLVKQCQKLIDYILKEKPGQGEYLMSIEKLLAEIASSQKTQENDDKKDEDVITIIKAEKTSEECFEILSEHHSKRVQKKELLRFIYNILSEMVERSLSITESDTESRCGKDKDQQPINVLEQESPMRLIRKHKEGKALNLLTTSFDENVHSGTLKTDEEVKGISKQIDSQPREDFIEIRMNSIAQILKKNPSLVKTVIRNYDHSYKI